MSKKIKLLILLAGLLIGFFALLSTNAKADPCYNYYGDRIPCTGFQRDDAEYMYRQEAIRQQHNQQMQQLQEYEQLNQLRNLNNQLNVIRSKQYLDRM